MYLISDSVSPNKAGDDLLQATQLGMHFRTPAAMSFAHHQQVLGNPSQLFSSVLYKHLFSGCPFGSRDHLQDCAAILSACEAGTRK